MSAGMGTSPASSCGVFVGDRSIAVVSGLYDDSGGAPDFSLSAGDALVLVAIVDVTTVETETGKNTMRGGVGGIVIVSPLGRPSFEACGSALDEKSRAPIILGSIVTRREWVQLDLQNGGA